MLDPTKYDKHAALKQVLGDLIGDLGVLDAVNKLISLSPSHPPRNNIRPRVINSGGKEESQWFEAQKLVLDTVLRRKVGEKDIKQVFAHFDHFHAFFHLYDTFVDVNITFFKWKVCNLLLLFSQNF